MTRIVITIVVVVVVLALAAGIALEALRLRQRRANVSADMSPARPVSRRPADPLPAPQPRAISGPHEVHLHFHGVNAKDVAAILAERDRPGGLT